MQIYNYLSCNTTNNYRQRDVPVSKQMKCEPSFYMILIKEWGTHSLPGKKWRDSVPLGTHPTTPLVFNQ